MCHPDVPPGGTIVDWNAVSHGVVASQAIAVLSDGTVTFTVLRKVRPLDLKLTLRVTTVWVGVPNSRSDPSEPRATTVLLKLRPGVAYAGLLEKAPARLAITTVVAATATATAAVKRFITPPWVRLIRRASP